MSIRVMTAVWDRGPQKQGHLLVMLALADYSNDQFECWPSMKSIAEKARMTERGAQKILRTLEAEGWLFIQTGNGRHGCNQYRINPGRLTTNDVHPEQHSPRTRTQETPNKDAETLNGGSPEPSLTIIEPSEDIKARKQSKRKSQIPDDAVLSEKMETIARNEGISQQEAEAQFDRFKGYCIANAKTYASWDAAWRNWLRSPFFKPITTGGHNGNRPNPAQGGNYPATGKQSASFASIVARRRNQQR